MKSTYADPTANAVIAKITREEREKARREKQSDRQKQREKTKKAATMAAMPRYSEWASMAG